MSVFGQAVAAVKSVMVMNQRFDTISDKLANLSRGLADLGRSHAELAQRVARLEGFIEGAAAASLREPRLPKE